MKQSILLKFILMYVLHACLLIFIALVPGRKMMADALMRMHADSLRRELFSIRDVSTEILTKETVSRERFRSFLCAIAEHTSSDIRMISTEGDIVLSTVESESQELPIAVSGFDYADYPEKGDFYGLSDTPCLNVVIPVTLDLETHGYLSASRSIKTILRDRPPLELTLAVILLIAFFASLLLFFGHIRIVYRPFRKILSGMQKFAEGNLDYKIPLSGTDEISVLASSMNYMADRIRMNENREKEFITNVSHDIRTPLTSIKGYTDAMSDGTIPPEQYDKYLKIISHEVDRLDVLTRDVLMLSSLEKGKRAVSLSEFDINALIRDTAELFEGACRKKDIAIKLILTGEHLTVRAEPDSVSVILYNLLDNAVKFSPRGGTIRIETTETRTHCYVAVKDEGPGIPHDEITRIWDRFYKCDSSRGLDKSGNGLGLAIVRETVNSLGQTITVVSTEGAGSEFKFSLDIG